jgi:hypothetical protein
MAKHATRIRLYSQPRPFPLDRVLAEPATALLVAGIVNPFGPTLTAVVVSGEPRPGKKLPVIQLMLNPFTQEVEAAGELALGDRWRPSAVIRAVFGLLFGSCPTLLMPSAHLEDKRSLSLHAEFLREFTDARWVLQGVREHLGNPWDRVSQEVSAASDGLVKVAAGVGGRPRSADTEPLFEAEATELARLLLSERHTKREIEAFLYAWGGSIKFQRDQGVPTLADAAMSLEAFQKVFRHIIRSCRVPDVGESPPTNPITELRATAETAFQHGGRMPAALPEVWPHGARRSRSRARDGAHDEADLGPEMERLLALADQPQSWPTLDPETLGGLVRLLCLCFGIAPAPEQLGRLGPLYEVFLARASRDDRLRTERAVAGEVLQGASAGALFPIMNLDTDLAVISTAALDFAVLAQPEEALGEFTGPRLLLAHAGPGSGVPERNRAGILMGLVLLGDRRLLPLLDGCWDWLGTEGQTCLTRCTSGFVTAGLVEFLLRWLEQTDQEGIFGGILGTLCRMPSIAAGGVVTDIERVFPVTRAAGAEEPIRLLRTWTFPAYYEEIRPRIERIAERESEPKLAPQLADYWAEP